MGNSIIYLHQYFKFPNETGGTRSYDLATSFLRQGYKVTVISASSDTAFNKSNRWSIVKKEGLEVHYIYVPYGNHLSYYKRMLAFFQFLWFSTFKLLSLKGDVILATSTPLTIGIPALIKWWVGKTPFVFEVRDVWPEAVIAIGAIKSRVVQKGLYYLEWLIYSNASAIVPLSTDMKASIIRRYPKINNKPIPVIENISEINRFQEGYDVVNLKQVIGFTPKFSILYAGTFGKVNGIDYVIDLAAKTQVIEPRLVYLLIGTGAEKENTIHHAREKGVLNKNVFIFDPISKEDLPKWYRAVDMGSSFVVDIPELWANSANKFFDTLAAGKPILINHNGWQATQIRKLNMGYVLSTVVTDSEAQKFLEYVADSLLVSEQKRNALKAATELYSLEVASKKYLDLFRDLKEYLR